MSDLKSKLPALENNGTVGSRDEPQPAEPQHWLFGQKCCHPEEEL